MKRIHKIEVTVVVFMICILLSISIPKFLHSQRNAAVTRVQFGLDTLFTALKAYANDNDGVLPHHVQRAGFTIFPFPKENRTHFYFLVDEGYMKTKEYDKIFNEHYHTRIYSHTNYDTQKGRRISNFGISIINPHYDIKHKGFVSPMHAYFKKNRYYESIKSKNSDEFEFSQMYYHISNGVESFGVIYQDYLGNRSSD